MENDKNIRKIVVVNEYDNEKKEWELNRVVFFMQDGAPILSSFDGGKENEISLLGDIASFIEKNGFDIQDNGFKNAATAGLINVISNLDKKAEATLNSEILKEQIKYGIAPEKIEEVKSSVVGNKENSIPNAETFENKEVEHKQMASVDSSPVYEKPKIGNNDERKIPLNNDDKALVIYLKNLETLKRKRRLAAEGNLRSDDDDINRCLDNMTNIAKYNERVATLEKARLELESNIISEKQYDDIYFEYRKNLATSIKSAYKLKENRELDEYFRKSDLRDNGMLPPVGLRRIQELASINTKIAAMEAAKAESNDLYENLKARYRLQPDEHRVGVDSALNLDGRLEHVEPEVQEQLQDSNRHVPPKVLQQYRRESVLPESIKNSDTTNKTPDLISNNSNQSSTVFEPNRRNVINLPESMGTPNYDGNVPPRFVGKDDSNNNETVPPKVSENYRIENVSGNNRTSKEPVPEIQGSQQTVEDYTQPKRRRRKNSNFVLNETAIPRDAKGVKSADGVQEEVEVQQETENSKKESDSALREVPPKKVKVTWTKKILKFLVGGAGLVLSALGITKLYDVIKNKKIEHIQQITSKNMSSVINNYCEKMNVPDKTKTFLNRVDVTNFLSQYKNSDQLNEVISAICFGYEANILTSEDGNFKLYEDGNSRLRMFTNDFLCAKAVINGYTPSQLLAVFGGTNISAEEVMKGFRNFYLTNMTYCTSAVKSLPYKYLTNGNTVSNEAFENLFSKLANVNEQRKAGTLTSRDTDAFIAAVHEFYTQSNNSGKYSEADRIFAASFVDAFAHVQANIASGEPLYLHKDYGNAKAGINLSEVSGSFADAKDKTTYEFNSLYDIINAKYGMYEAYGSDCKGLEDTLEDNLYKMNLVASGSKEQSALTLANALYKNGLDKYAERVTKGKIDQNLLDEIENANPALADEIDEYQRSVLAVKSNYVPFDITVNGVDELLGIKGLTNSQVIPNLINTRRELAFNYDNYKVLDGKWYTSGYRRGGKSYNKSVTVTTTRQEKVDYDALSSSEKKEADSQRQELIAAEEERLQTGVKDAEQVAQQIVDKIETGDITSQEEAQEIANSVGMKLEENVVETIKELHEKTGLEEQKAAERDAKTREEAEQKHQAEAEAQAQAALQQAELINQSLQLEGGASTVPETPSTPSGGDVQTDPDRVDSAAGEEPYVLNDTVSSLQSLKAAALAAADMVQDVNTNDTQKVLSLNA